MTFHPKTVPPSIGYYLAGFTDGEGSFNLSFRKRCDYHQPWKISLCFNVSQRDKVILCLFKKHLQCGTLRKRRDEIWYYEVNNFNAIIENVIPFFNCYGFLSAKKKRDFAQFKQIAILIQQEAHLTEEGLHHILHIRREMNDGGAGRRKYSEADIVSRLIEGTSSETVCQTLLSKE